MSVNAQSQRPKQGDGAATVDIHVTSYGSVEATWPHADAVVLRHVLGGETKAMELPGSIIPQTVSRVRILESFKGGLSEGEETLITQVAGEVSVKGRKYKVSPEQSAALKVGAKYILFLLRGEAATYGLVTGPAGAYLVVNGRARTQFQSAGEGADEVALMKKLRAYRDEHRK